MTTTEMTITVTHERMYKTRQALEGERIVTVTTRSRPGAETPERPAELRLRATVTRDSYDFQSWARVSLMTEASGWEYLTGLEVALMDIGTRWNGYGRSSVPVGADSWEDDMTIALDALIRLGIEVMA